MRVGRVVFDYVLGSGAIGDCQWLPGDPIHWASIFKSLCAFLQVDAVFGPRMESLRNSWAIALSPGPDTGFAAISGRCDQVVPAWRSVGDATGRLVRPYRTTR